MQTNPRRDGNGENHAQKNSQKFDQISSESSKILKSIDSTEGSPLLISSPSLPPSFPPSLYIKIPLCSSVKPFMPPRYDGHPVSQTSPNRLGDIECVEFLVRAAQMKAFEPRGVAGGLLHSEGSLAAWATRRWGWPVEWWRLCNVAACA